MDVLSAVILGVVQGLTEFLPVSSTGHLILAREVLGLNTEYGLAVDAVLHFATAFAVLLYFRNDFLKLLKTAWAFVTRKPIEEGESNLMWALIVGTIPAVVLGLMLEDMIETTFRSAELVAYVLIAGSILFLVAEYVAKKIHEKQEVTIKKGLAVGCFQALALLPGMSRSGATISGGLLLGFSREQAARFAFLLSLPIILGAGTMKVLDLQSAGVLVEQGGMIALAAIAAFLSGLAAIHYLLKFLRNHTLLVFVVYRLILAGVVLWLV